MAVSAAAQTPAKAAATAADTENVVMLSDIHFDPFHDPVRLSQLMAKPITQWADVLATPSATQAADFTALLTTCKVRGVDTPWALLESSLKAEHAAMPKPLFVTVSGDLMAHQFDCRFHTLIPKGDARDYSLFAAKTVAFVAQQVHKAFPGVPVFLALGNNDSGCRDYAEDAKSRFLKEDAQSFAGVSMSQVNGAAILDSFPEYGDVNLMMPRPMEHTRLIVLQDIFESKKYVGCDGAPNVDAETAQIAWLRKQLDAAKSAGQHVWVMAHIPPGIDAYSTLTKNVCGGEKPTMFLADTKLADTLVEYAGTVSLGLFGHTHMDEMKLLGGVVPVKLVPSISPVNGNNPAFTVTSVDAKTAMLMDYTVYAASNQTGVDTVWSKEYTYSAAYGMKDYTATSVKMLMDGFLGDKTGASAASKTYESFYFVGEPAALGGSGSARAAAMQMVWHGYACSMTEGSESGFRGCLCGPAK